MSTNAYLIQMSKQQSGHGNRGTLTFNLHPINVISQGLLSASIGIGKARFMRKRHLVSVEMTISCALQNKIRVSKDQVVNRVMNEILDQSSEMLTFQETHLLFFSTLNICDSNKIE